MNDEQKTVIYNRLKGLRILERLLDEAMLVNLQQAKLPMVSPIIGAIVGNIRVRIDRHESELKE